MPIYSKTHFYNILHLNLVHQTGHFLPGFLSKILYAFFFSPMHHTCPIYNLILVDFYWFLGTCKCYLRLSFCRANDFDCYCWNYINWLIDWLIHTLFHCYFRSIGYTACDNLGRWPRMLITKSFESKRQWHVSRYYSPSFVWRDWPKLHELRPYTDIPNLLAMPLHQTAWCSKTRTELNISVRYLEWPVTVCL